ncbi:replication stress response regulator SDE2 [Anoplophora glabripennis]|uniref:replication stress response regulator SDE2 n=1 Tax=Anoplophora glabripennis TaxID=217634 RepID=UPI0008758917|nr:replication stress response regulator SDE2 [Anoplophora glabripennis]
MEIYINAKHQLFLNHTTVAELRCFLQKELGLEPEEYYLLSNGKLVDQCSDLEYNKVHIVPRVFGGKGGFGSMLRAIGAQIEKTTNREACRDLSGRRLRDINEEQRLKNWINQQAEREKEAKERKQKKLERLCETPRHEFKDEQYDKERSELPEVVEDAVIQGLEASCSSKRKATEKKPVVKKKKAKLWLDDELEDDLSSSDAESDEGESEENKNSSGTQKTSESENSSNSECTGELHKGAENAVRIDDSTEDKSNNKTIENLENDCTKDTEKEDSNEIDEKIKEEECGTDNKQQNAEET